MASKKSELDRFTFGVAKSQDYRRIYADGAMGGIQKNGGFALTFYNEIPDIGSEIVRKVKHVDEGLALGQEESSNDPTEMRFERLLESSVFMTLETAVQLRDFLLEAFPLQEHEERSTNGEEESSET